MPEPSPPHSAASSGGLRAAVERASSPLLRRLTGMPPWLPFAVIMALVLGGAVAGGVPGTVLVGLAALVVAWLLYLSWPQLALVERLMRVAVLGVVFAIALTQLLPR